MDDNGKGSEERPTTLEYMEPAPGRRDWTIFGYGCIGLFWVATTLLCGGGASGPWAVSVALTLPASAIAAIAFGVAGRRRQTDGGVRADAKWLCILGIAHLAMLLAVAFIIPQLGRPKERANRVKCQSNLSQIGKGLLLYSTQYRVYPPQLDALLIEGDLSPWVFICPSSDDEPATGPTTRAVAQNMITKKGHLSYVYLGAQVSPRNPDPETVLVYEPLTNHDGAGANFLFANGDARWLDAAAAKYKISELQAGHNPPRPRAQPATRE